MSEFDPRHKSRVITEGADKTANRAMLRAMGLGDAELAQPFVGVATVWSESTPCNVNLDEQGLAVAEAVRRNGGDVAAVQHDLRFGWDRHGARGDAGVARVAGGYRGFGGADDAGARL